MIQDNCPKDIENFRNFKLTDDPGLTGEVEALMLCD
jgi:hypothetical protein